MKVSEKQILQLQKLYLTKGVELTFEEAASKAQKLAALFETIFISKTSIL